MSVKRPTRVARAANPARRGRPTPRRRSHSVRASIAAFNPIEHNLNTLFKLAVDTYNDRLPKNARKLSTNDRDSDKVVRGLFDVAAALSPEPDQFGARKKVVSKVDAMFDPPARNADRDVFIPLDEYGSGKKLVQNNDGFESSVLTSSDSGSGSDSGSDSGSGSDSEPEPDPASGSRVAPNAEPRASIRPEPAPPRKTDADFYGKFQEYSAYLGRNHDLGALGDYGSTKRHQIRLRDALNAAALEPSRKDAIERLDRWYQTELRNAEKYGPAEKASVPRAASATPATTRRRIGPASPIVRKYLERLAKRFDEDVGELHFATSENQESWGLRLRDVATEAAALPKAEALEYLNAWYEREAADLIREKLSRKDKTAAGKRLEPPDAQERFRKIRKRLSKRMAEYAGVLGGENSDTKTRLERRIDSIASTAALNGLGDTYVDDRFVKALEDLRVPLSTGKGSKSGANWANSGAGRTGRPLEELQYDAWIAGARLYTTRAAKNSRDGDGKPIPGTTQAGQEKTPHALLKIARSCTDARDTRNPVFRLWVIVEHHLKGRPYKFTAEDYAEILRKSVKEGISPPVTRADIARYEKKETRVDPDRVEDCFRANPSRAKASKEGKGIRAREYKERRERLAGAMERAQILRDDIDVSRRRSAEDAWTALRVALSNGPPIENSGFTDSDGDDDESTGSPVAHEDRVWALGDDVDLRDLDMATADFDSDSEVAAAG